MPEIKMPPPPPPPAPMDAPDIAEAELEMVSAGQDRPGGKTGSKRYRKMNKGKGKSGGTKSYKGGGLNN